MSRRVGSLYELNQSIGVSGGDGNCSYVIGGCRGFVVAHDGGGGGGGEYCVGSGGVGGCESIIKIEV
ncbi:Hypothetical predicted protein [Octopus vulgaris]|uniref:Uncharacterized protein n=1 Tax=Octopus vulgaris TaxID=6645 RepID=A0AA36BQV3_OCTVU|nr:Hypothetical predicted protein [Octopus vulgaris]